MSLRPSKLRFGFSIALMLVAIRLPASAAAGLERPASEPAADPSMIPMPSGAVTPALGMSDFSASLSLAVAADGVTPTTQLGGISDAAVDAAPAGYLSDEEMKNITLPPAPAPGSPTDQEDLAVVKAWQAKRTPEDCHRANSEVHASYSSFFSAMSPFPEPMPIQAKTLLAKAFDDTALASERIKQANPRYRPYRRDPSVTPCIRLPGDDDKSYPSGHAALARLLGLILSDLQPQRRSAFMARADEVALDRIIGGVHNPSDVQAGMKLGDELYAELTTLPAFLSDLEKARAVVSR